MNTFSPATKAKSAEVNQNFTDLSTGIADTDDNRLALLRQDIWNDFAPSGCVWSQVSGLTGAMTLGVAYVSNGTIRSRLAVAAIASKVFTASKDTYVTLSSSNTIAYTEVANGATPPAWPANSMPVAKVITSGAAITAIHMLTPRNYDEIGRVNVVMGTTDSIILPNIPGRKYLKISGLLLPSGNLNARLLFNNDTGTNYAQQFQTDMTSPTSDLVSQASIEIEGGNGTRVEFFEIEMMNIATQVKLGVNRLVNDAGTSASSTAPDSFTNFLKWSNTVAQITRLDMTNTGTGDFAVGSEFFVRGVN